MRLKKVKNIEEKIQEYSDIIIFDGKACIGKWHEMFSNNNPIYLEIGMGKGKFITTHALQNPNINYIGLEIVDSVIYKAAKNVRELKEEGKLNNLILLNADAAYLDLYFNKLEINKIFLNFSDPWPKTRHEKRRLTSSHFLQMYKNILGLDGIIEMKTDGKKLFEYSIMKFNEFGFTIEELNLDLHNSLSTEEDDLSIITTEYEEKFKSNGQVIYYTKVRIK